MSARQRSATIGGATAAPSTCYVKPPPQFADDETHHPLESYIASHALPSRKATQRRETIGAD